MPCEPQPCSCGLISTAMPQLLILLLLGVVIRQTSGEWSLAGAPEPLTSYTSPPKRPARGLLAVKVPEFLEPVAEPGDDTAEMQKRAPPAGQAEGDSMAASGDEGEGVEDPSALPWRYTQGTEVIGIPHGVLTPPPAGMRLQAPPIPSPQPAAAAPHLPLVRQSSWGTNQTHAVVPLEEQRDIQSSAQSAQGNGVAPTGHSEKPARSQVTPPLQVSVGAARQMVEDDWLFAGSGDWLIAAVDMRDMRDSPGAQRLPDSRTYAEWGSAGAAAEGPDQTTPTPIPSLKSGGGAPSLLPSPAERPCAWWRGPCVEPAGPDGTALRWDDLRRTLSFSWELHVYGTGALSLALAAAALLGLITPQPGAPPHGCLVLTNVLLLLAGGLRAAHFLLDPYGSRGRLARCVVTALHNLPLPLLLWAQAALALLASQGASRAARGPRLQYPLLAGVCAALHCSLLLAADLLSAALSPTVPVLLQALSLSWGLGLSLGLLACARPWLHPAALQGALCCALHVHALLWLYGLLGDWRRFSWSWWLTQLWARLLELAWAWTLLLLASGGPRGARSSGSRAEPSVPPSLWAALTAYLAGCSRRTEDSLWAELLPNNWAGLLVTRSAGQAGRGTEPTVVGGHAPPAAASVTEDVESHSERRAGAGGGLDWGPQRSLASESDFQGTPMEPNQSVLLQRLLLENSRFWPSFSQPTSPATAPPTTPADTAEGDMCQDPGVTPVTPQGTHLQEDTASWSSDEITPL